LVHWGVNRHTVDKSRGLSVIIPKKKKKKVITKDSSSFSYVERNKDCPFKA
jgi:hypothetical protein